MSEEEYPEADRLEGMPHPRETQRLFGQDAAEQVLVDAIAGGRLHHAWLLSGPRGVGKATLAWRAARYLLATPPTSGSDLFGGPERPDNLDVPAEHPVARRVLALSDPGLLLIRRPWDTEKKRFKTQITVDEVRRLNGFFGMSATDRGYRVVIVDSADEMNTAAANALLKVLEEPPKKAVLFLVSHRPSRLLPTIRSRCRELKLAPLAPDALAAAVQQAGGDVGTADGLGELAGGSVGEALRLGAEDGAALYSEIIDLMAGAPRMDRRKAIALAEKAAQRGAEERLDLTLRLIDTALGRMARHGAGHASAPASPKEPEVFARLSPNLRRARAWSDLHQSLGARLAHGRAVNIDSSTLLLDAFLKINETAGQS